MCRKGFFIGFLACFYVVVLRRYKKKKEKQALERIWIFRRNQMDVALPEVWIVTAPAVRGSVRHCKASSNWSVHLKVFRIQF